MRGLYILTALALLNVCQGQTTYGDPALAGRCPANTEDTVRATTALHCQPNPYIDRLISFCFLASLQLATLLSVVQTQRNAQAALTTRVRQKMVRLRPPW
jgi:hypothetical protein